MASFGNDSMEFPALTDTLDDITSEIEPDHILSAIVGSNPGDVTVEHISQPDQMPGMLETIYGPSTVRPDRIVQVPDVLQSGDAIGDSNPQGLTAVERIEKMGREAHASVSVRIVKPTRLSTVMVLIPIASVQPGILVAGSDQRRYKITFNVKATGTDVVYLASSQAEAAANIGYPITNGLIVESTDDIYIGPDAANAAAVQVFMMVERWG